MKRTFNFTNRLRIEKSRIDITILEAVGSEAPLFAAQLDFEGLELPPEARIVISSYRLSFAMRFDWGTVENPTPPEDRRLTETPVNPRFRVMVLAPDGSGRIYAMCDRITPSRGEAGAKSLLWLDEVDDLGQEVWRLDTREGHPTLDVNQAIGNISTDARHSGMFRSLVIPEVLRSILRQALIEEDADPDGESGEWEDWMEFLQQFDVGQLPQPGPDGKRDPEGTHRWIDHWVNAFVNDRLPARDHYLAARSGN